MLKISELLKDYERKIEPLKDIVNPNILNDLKRGWVNLQLSIEVQEIFINELKLKTAMYKAKFYTRYDLAEKLQNQITENLHSCITNMNEIFIIAYKSTVYRTIKQMFNDGLIAEEEYKFCIDI